MALPIISAATSLPRLLSFPATIPKYALISSSPSQFSLTQCSSLFLSKPSSAFNVSIHLGVSLKLRRPGKRNRRMGSKYGSVYASLFGVGAPEALVIGVVALLVFGPKGLAEVARNLGKTLRAFQPTIRELQDVSREFKSTLEREIGLDDLTTPQNYRPTPTYKNGPPAAGKPYTSEDYLNVTEERLKASTVTAAEKQPETSTRENVSEATSETITQLKKPKEETPV